MVSGKPIYVLRQFLLELEVRCLTVPGYSFLQDTVGQALNFEQNRLAGILKERLTPSDRQALNALLDDKSGLYHIALNHHWLVRELINNRSLKMMGIFSMTV